MIKKRCRKCRKTLTFGKNNMSRLDFLNIIEQIADIRKTPSKTEVSDKRFTMLDDASAEIETCEFIWAFTRRLKPINILETGTFHGVTAAVLASALRENGFGHLFTLEINQFNIDKAQELWGKLALFNLITVQKVNSLEYIPKRNCQFMFLDSEPNIRLKELVRFYPYLDEGGYVFIHDMPPNQCRGNINTDHPDFLNWPVGDIPKEFDEMIKNRRLLPFYFPDARSLMGLYKPTKKDFI